ncbi:hypothetical protein KEJ18_02345 [Candidatus Bathyarchaeota archaeon]|nr:hypothetical protein [Candidatus Bathyarchaeota archaeon]
MCLPQSYISPSGVAVPKAIMATPTVKCNGLVNLCLTCVIFLVDAAFRRIRNVTRTCGEINRRI